MTEPQEINPFGSLGVSPGAVNYGKFSFTVKRYVLADLCEHAAVAVPSRETVPVLTCFQVQVSHAGLRVAATDMERTVFTQTEAAVSDADEPQQVYLPAKKLVNMLHEAPEGEISVSIRKNKATVAASGTRWELKLPDPGPYPALPDPAAISLTPFSREKLLLALRSVRHAICRDASRSNLTQVHLTEAVVTSSDGSRMARVEMAGFPMAASVPSGAAEDLIRLLSSSPDVTDVEIGQTEGMVVFRVGHVTLAASKRHSAFPNVEDQLLKPAEGNADVLAIDKAQLQAAVKRVRINADTGTSAIALDIAPGEVALVSRDKNGNSARETIPAKWDKGSRLVVVNHVFLGEAVDAHPDQVCEFRLGEDVGKKKSMVLLTGGGLVQVLTQMPPALVGY